MCSLLLPLVLFIVALCQSDALPVPGGNVDKGKGRAISSPSTSQEKDNHQVQGYGNQQFQMSNPYIGQNFLSHSYDLSGHQMHYQNQPRHNQIDLELTLGRPSHSARPPSFSNSLAMPEQDSWSHTGTSRFYEGAAHLPPPTTGQSQHMANAMDTLWLTPVDDIYVGERKDRRGRPPGSKNRNKLPKEDPLLEDTAHSLNEEDVWLPGFHVNSSRAKKGIQTRQQDLLRSRKRRTIDRVKFLIDYYFGDTTGKEDKNDILEQALHRGKLQGIFYEVKEDLMNRTQDWKKDDVVQQRWKSRDQDEEWTNIIFALLRESQHQTDHASNSNPHINDHINSPGSGP